MKKEIRFFAGSQDQPLLSENDLIKKSYWLSWGGLSLSLLILGLVWNLLPNMIPLFYSLPWGELRLAHKAWLGLLPVLGLIFSWLNLSLSKKLINEDNFLQTIMAIISLIESGFLVFIMLGIISIML